MAKILKSEIGFLKLNLQKRFFMLAINPDLKVLNVVMLFPCIPSIFLSFHTKMGFQEVLYRIIRLDIEILEKP